MKAAAAVAVGTTATVGTTNVDTAAGCLGRLSCYCICNCGILATNLGIWATRRQLGDFGDQQVL